MSLPSVKAKANNCSLVAINIICIALGNSNSFCKISRQILINNDNESLWMNWFDEAIAPLDLKDVFNIPKLESNRPELHLKRNKNRPK